MIEYPKVLSILICTVPERSKMFFALCDKINRQIAYCQTVHPSLGRVELIFDDSKKFAEGGLSIGKKREALVKRAEGYYLAFVDDDEDVAPNYVETILRFAQYNADIITFRNFTILGGYWMLIDMSLFYSDDQPSPKFTVRRKPWHCCPVKRTFAQLYDFQDINYGEDSEWMSKVLTHCTNEAKTDAILHMYNHGKHSLADEIIRNNA